MKHYLQPCVVCIPFSETDVLSTSGNPTEYEGNLLKLNWEELT